MPYYSLASGFLTGKYRTEEDLSKSVRGGGVKKYLNEKGFGILKALDQVSAKHNATPAAAAIAWLMAQAGITAPIASATSKSQLQTFSDAVNLNLDAEDLKNLDSASQ
jgi:aryl-alcohol dehydrogenase-like predicted oxidoreductase